ncbi:uncharacterized protein LOC113512840 isoform X2 [Galleria mellonella]|uniref:Speckle targeted PIP5K1A-regulated poly(A) polymerase n=1 Tax=Galleria mellonella TaxID=7137 RepID=A0ABM3MH67_GALME|nr:uncharacterized protein LOC113512840 isoform X2 [Galleria mellonella]
MEAARASQGCARSASDKSCTVHVSGYPKYTQPQDLTRTFLHFGNAKVDKMNQKFATLTFSNSLEAKSAVLDSNKVAVYGSFLTVQPYSPQQAAEAPRQQNNNKRDFSRSKQKGSTAIPFGSIPTGLGIKTSDADCFVKVPPQYRRPNANFVNKTARLLRQYPRIFAEILPIPRANTPIVKFFHIPTATNCDVTFKTELGARNSSLIHFLLRADPRLIPMAVLIKYWAKVHEMSGSGRLTNYALTMLIIFYLQQPPNPILPPIRWLQQDPNDDYIVDHWNTGFMNRLESLPPTRNRSTISELIGGFFEYYSVFDFEKMIVCPYLGYPIQKDLFKDLDTLPEGFERYKENIRNLNTAAMRFTTSWCAQDPFEQCHNIASPVSSRLASNIKIYLKFAAEAYQREKSNKCEMFLKSILLDKPKIAKEKGHPEFRSNLFPKFISSIVDPDWKSVVRSIIFIIFETMLKIKLGKVEEKVNPDSKKEKEKYMGTVTKPIWKRKAASKSHGLMHLDLQQKQAKITEEVMNFEKEQINIQFQLILTYSHDPKRAVVAIKLNNGDIAAFKEFGKFFISILQSWFMQLLTPYAKSSTNDTASKIAETIKFLDSNHESNNVDRDDDTLSE